MNITLSIDEQLVQEPAKSFTPLARASTRKFAGTQHLVSDARTPLEFFGANIQVIDGVRIVNPFL
jgi:hypothetical protein